MSNFFEVKSLLSFQRMDFRGHRDEIRKLWLELQTDTAPSFFLAWGWVSVWLDTIPESSNVDFVLLRKDGEPYCCFFIGVRKELHHWLFYKTRAYLNETGDDEIDDLTIEYNMVLGAMDKADWLCLLSDPQFSEIEELCFSNITRQTYEQIDIGEHYEVKDCQQKPSYYVDLSEVRVNGRSYLELLSSNKRAQIKKSLAYYEEGGVLSVRQARTASEALEFLEKLKEFHQARWTTRGKPGAFSRNFFVRFHRQLVEERFASGEVQLLAIGNSNKTIGYLYNFIHDNRVYYYQSGFCYETNNIARPGIVCHYLAIEHNLAGGRDVYSFLAGETQYKRSLSTHSDQLYTLVAVRKNFTWLLEKRLRAAKRTLVALLPKVLLLKK